MQYYRSRDEYLEIAKCFKAIYDTMEKNPNLYLSKIYEILMLDNVETFYM